MHTLETINPPAMQGARVFFQSATANAWARSFLLQLRRELERTSLPDQRQHLARVCYQTQTLFNARCQKLPDVSSYTALGMCGLLLTAYRELLAELGNPGQAFGIVERSFDHAYQAFIQNICKPLLLNPNRSLQALRRMNFKAWSAPLYQQDMRAPAVPQGVTATGYQQFFLAHQEPGLAHIMDAADQAWIKVLEAYRQAPHNEQRRAQAATGTDPSGFSPFQFAANIKKRPSPKPDVVLELHISDPSRNLGRERRAGAGARPDRRRSCIDLEQRQAERRRHHERDWSLRNAIDRRASLNS